MFIVADLVSLKELGKRDKMQVFINNLSLIFNELMNSIIPKHD